MASILYPLCSSPFLTSNHCRSLLLLTSPPPPLKFFNKDPNFPRNKLLAVGCALAESNSPNFLDDQTLPLLQELADSLVLSPDYFAQLPRDLRLDLNDAGFDLASGPVIEECGQELGEMLLNLSQAWEQADTSTSNGIASKLPSLHGSWTGNAKSAFGKRLISAGRRFEAMGLYGQGELQRIAKAMIKTGKFLSTGPVITTDDQPKKESRMLKFGELQVELTSMKANIGAAIGFAFGILSWQLSQGIQSVPESSLEYANDNALLLAKSLRGALIAVSYSSAILSASACVGLILLARQLSSEDFGRYRVTTLVEGLIEDNKANLSTSASIFWMEISRDQLKFDRLKIRLTSLKLYGRDPRIIEMIVASSTDLPTSLSSFVIPIMDWTKPLKSLPSFNRDQIKRCQKELICNMDLVPNR